MVFNKTIKCFQSHAGGISENLISISPTVVSLAIRNLASFEPKGPFKYYVIKEVGGWGCQMMMFDDKVDGWGWLNDDVIRQNAHHQYQNLFEIYLFFQGYH